MSAPHIGSRYELLVDPHGDEEIKTHATYAEVYDTDLVDAEDDKRDDDRIGYVHSVEIGSTVDGPGIRFVLFLTGCPLRCQYCHNPDTWHKLNGQPVTLDEMKAEIFKYERVLKISGGGLTISGGEPVQQHGFVTAIFRYCKSHGIHTCLDTSGRLGARMTDAELADVDLHLLDIKSGDPEVYKRVTGHPLEPTLAYARRLSDLGRPMWVRFVLVPGLTDGHDNVEKIADIVAGLKTVQRVEILKFHQMGADKWAKLGIPYPLADTQPPTPELVERVRGQFRRRGLTVF
ncbi:MAG: pyruvate formate lyase-activating protein [Rubrivivax sp.]|nr:pyruvate formate lyase-activating protein [Rubrivivax sp.]HOW46894.1 pyruvate formate-lyase-activating protein [Rubrivivax sp.]HRY87333.1 pyruvate formate-lyase-activating protein [Rubrivivax sp.]